MQLVEMQQSTQRKTRQMMTMKLHVQMSVDMTQVHQLIERISSQWTVERKESTTVRGQSTTQGTMMQLTTKMTRDKTTDTTLRLSIETQLVLQKRPLIRTLTVSTD